MVRFDPGERTQLDSRVLAGLPTNVPLVGMVAQLTPWKGQIDAIRALPHIHRSAPETVLVVAGGLKFVSRGTRFDNSRYVETLRAEVERLGVGSQVLFLGERADVPEVVQALDVLLMPSWEEPLGRIAIEAMSMGTAVVVTSIGGPPEFVDQGRTGLLVPPRNCEALAAATARLLVDKRARASMAKAGQAFVRDRFSQERFVDNVLGVYRGLERDTIPTSIRSCFPS
jgi:glycosyltransferase involved in cell wall biosynthesis